MKLCRGICESYKGSNEVYSMIFICRAKPTAYLEINILHVVVVVVPLPNIELFKGSLVFLSVSRGSLVLLSIP